MNVNTRIFLSLLLLTILSGNTFADITINVKSIPSECYADGSLSITLSGNEVSQLSGLVTYSLSGSNLTSPRSSEALPTEEASFQNLPKGIYTITLTAILDGNFLTRTTTAIVESDYITMSARVVLSNSRSIIGTRPTFSCQETGKIQLLIQGGNFPYTVVMSGTRNETYTFDAPQNEGLNSAEPDYKDYYTFEDLAAGTYKFIVKDGCNHTLPQMEETVKQVNVDFDCDKNLFILPSAPKNPDNVIRFNLLYDYNTYPYKGYEAENYKYWNEHANEIAVWWEYAYIYDGGSMSSWKDIPADGIVYDTVKSAVGYCDIWKKDYTFHIRVKGCTAETCTKKITVPKPTHNFYYSIKYDPITGCEQDTFVHAYSSGYFTFPINLTAQSLTTPVSTIWDTTINKGIYSIDNYWSIFKRISPALPLMGEDVSLKITDKNNCEIIDAVYTPDLIVAYWSWSYSDTLCGRNQLTMYYQQAEVIPDGTQIKLIQSPTFNSIPNYYNFTATYDKSKNVWTAVQDHTGTHTIHLNKGIVRLHDDQLMSGNYEWETTIGCKNTVMTYTMNTYFHTYTIDEPFSLIHSKNTCSGVEYQAKGKITQTHNGTGATKDVTEFRITPQDGQAGGYSIYDDGAAGKRMVFNRNGVYKITMCYLAYGVPELSPPVPCEHGNKTITVNINNLRLKDFIGYICVDKNSTNAMIEVRVDPETGVAPYNHTLYSEKDGEGSVVDRKSGASATFNCLSEKGKMISVKIEDDCRTSFIQNIEIMSIGANMSDAAIAKEKNVCEGKVIELQGMPIGTESLVTYHWTGPNDFTARKRVVTINPATFAMAGEYKVDIQGLNCELNGSVEIAILPSSTTTTVVDSICVGNNYNGNKFKELSTAELSSGKHQFTEMLKSAAGCDSLVVLDLTIRALPDIISQSAITACADNKTVEVNYTQSKGNPMIYSILFDNFAKSKNFEDIIEKPLPASPIIVKIPQDNDTEDNTKYIEPNYYKATLNVKDEYCYSKPVPLSIAIHYPSWITTQKWNDVITLFNDKYNGGYTFSKYQWYKNNEPIEGATQSYIYLLPNLDYTASYSVLLTRKRDQVSISTCPIKPQPTEDILVYPTIGTRGRTVSVISENPCSVMIWNSLGVCVSQQALLPSMSNLVLPKTPGHYFLEITTDQQKKKVVKIIVQ